MSEAEIACRFRRSPSHIRRTLHLTTVDCPTGQDRAPSAAEALERTVVRARNEGASHVEIAARLRRTPGFVARIERFAALRNALPETA